MKQLNITYEDKDHEVIEQAKKIHGGNWHDFFLDLSREYIGIKKEGKTR